MYASALVVERPYIEEIETPEEFVEAVEKILTFWLDSHTNPVVWASEWIIDDDISYTFHQYKNGISNDYFSFDWQAAALSQYAKDNRHDWEVCKRCGDMVEAGYGQECRCEEEGREGNFKTPTVKQLTEYLCEMVEMGVTLNISEDVMFRALQTEGFKVYTNALKSVIAGPVAEVKETLRRLKRARTNEDKFTVALSGTAVWHVHGNIFADYGEQLGLDSDVIDRIRNEGPMNYFGRELLEEYFSD